MDKITSEAPHRIWAAQIGTATKGGQTFSIGHWITDETIGHPHSYILEADVAKLLADAEARGWNSGMLTATSIVAEQRNSHEPGPLFKALNEAVGHIDSARFAAIHTAKAAP